MTIKHFKKGDTIYQEFQVPEMFYILYSGILSVEKQIEINYSNLWPVHAHEWNHFHRK